MSETVALAVAVFESVKGKAYRAHLAMIAHMARMIAEDDLWILDPDWDRRTYPFCVRGMVDEMFRRESLAGHRADWFFWLEDDIVPLPDVYEKLRQHADKEGRPFVAALAYCRTKPFWPGVADVELIDNLIYVRQWKEAPESGLHPADRMGMCAALFHRSLFDRIKEPWFAVDVANGRGVGPDAFWCRRLKDSGIQPYVCCDVELGHIGPGSVITREISERWNALRKSEGRPA